MLQITGLLKKFPSFINPAEHDQVGLVGSDGDCEDETVKRSPLISKNLNGTTGYLTFKARLAFIQLRKAFTKSQSSNILT